MVSGDPAPRCIADKAANRQLVQPVNIDALLFSLLKHRQQRLLKMKHPFDGHGPALKK
nr:MAG TPA: hypothetical protein [Caudoviricetes sp.]